MASWSTEHKTQAGFVTAIIALIGMSLVAFAAINARQDSAKQLAAAENRLLTLSRVLEGLDAVSAAQDAFMISGNDAELLIRTDALRFLRDNLETMNSGVKLQPPRWERYTEIDTSAAAVLQLMDAVLIQYRSAGLQAVKDSAIRLQAQLSKQQLRSLIDKAIDDEEASIQATRLLESRSGMTLYVVQGLASLFAFAVLLWLATYIRHELRERRHTENQLRDATIYFESLIENIPAMIFIKDAKALRFVRINRAGEALLGIKREELIGKSDHDFFPADQVDFFINKDRQVLAQDKVLEIPEEAIDTRTHGQRWLHTLKVPLMNSQNQPALLMGISMDITEQRMAEQRIKVLNAELEQKAKLLKVSNNELETFCYSVSHDLRAPLRTIDGFAQLLEENQRGSLGADALHYLDTIRRASKQMSQLIDDLLAYSKVGRQTITLQKLDMTKLATEATAVVAFGRSPRPIIEIGALPQAFGDETMLHSVWLNLVDNAIKYSTKNATPKISITAHQDGNYVTYSVRDNGVGFDMQYYEKLFDVFERLHSDREFAGTGLGLAIVERIVSRHGGRVWAESKPGQGATFYFSLPVEAELAAC